MSMRLSSSLAMIALIGAITFPGIASAQCARWRPFPNYSIQQGTTRISMTGITHSNSFGRHPAQHFSGNARTRDTAGKVSGSVLLDGRLSFTITWNRRLVAGGRRWIDNPSPVVGTYTGEIIAERAGRVVNGWAEGGGSTVRWDGLTSIPCMSDPNLRVLPEGEVSRSRPRLRLP